MVFPCMKEDGEKEMKFPWVEIGITIAVGSLVSILVYPQYKDSKRAEKEAVVKYNIHVIQVAMEKYAVNHQGHYPKISQEIEPFIEYTPANPFTQMPLSIEEVQFFLYPHTGDNRDNSLDGIHGRQVGSPGGIGIGIYAVPGDTIIPEDTLAPEDTLVRVDSLVTEYGLMGFDQGGMPLTIVNPAGKDYIYVLRK